MQSMSNMMPRRQENNGDDPNLCAGAELVNFACCL